MHGFQPAPFPGLQSAPSPRAQRCPRAAHSRSCAGMPACSQPRRLSRIPWGEGRPRREHQNCKNRSSWRQECILSTPASSCGHARQSLFLRTVGRGPQRARQNQERLGDTQLSPGSVRDRSHQEAPCCRMSLRQCREKNICSDSCFPATPILHQFPPLLLLVKGLRTLDRTAALSFCSEKQQRVHPPFWLVPPQQLSPLSRDPPRAGGLQGRRHACRPEVTAPAATGTHCVTGAEELQPLLQPTSGQEEGGQDTACWGGKVCC